MSVIACAAPSGAGGQAEAKGAVKSPLPAAAIDELRSGSGRVVLASSRRDEVSWTGNPYSVFTAALLEGLAGYGAFEQDGYARVLDLALWAGRKVRERTVDRQHPIIKVSNLADDSALAGQLDRQRAADPTGRTGEDDGVSPEEEIRHGYSPFAATTGGNTVIVAAPAPQLDSSP